MIPVLLNDSEILIIELIKFYYLILLLFRSKLPDFMKMMSDHFLWRHHIVSRKSQKQNKTKNQIRSDQLINQTTKCLSLVILHITLVVFFKIYIYKYINIISVQEHWQRILKFQTNEIPFFSFLFVCFSLLFFFLTFLSRCVHFSVCFTECVQKGFFRKLLNISWCKVSNGSCHSRAAWVCVCMCVCGLRQGNSSLPWKQKHKKSWMCLREDLSTTTTRVASRCGKRCKRSQ